MCVCVYPHDVVAMPNTEHLISEQFIFPWFDTVIILLHIFGSIKTLLRCCRLLFLETSAITISCICQCVEDGQEGVVYTDGVPVG